MYHKQWMNINMGSQLSGKKTALTFVASVVPLNSSLKSSWKTSNFYISQRNPHSTSLRFLCINRQVSAASSSGCYPTLSISRISRNCALTESLLNPNCHCIHYQLCYSQKPHWIWSKYSTRPDSLRPAFSNQYITRSSLLPYIRIPPLTIEEEGFIHNVCSAIMQSRWDSLQQFAAQLNAHLVTGVLQHLLSDADLAVRFLLGREGKGA